MYKIMIKNNSLLSIKVIGEVIDYLQKNGKEDTHYIGQVEWTTLEYFDNKIKIQIRYLKNWVEWYFEDIK